MILEFAPLARVVRSSDWDESMNTSRASRESATAARRLSSLTELTRDPHDSLYRGRPSASYHRGIGQPERVPTQMKVISGCMVNPDRVEPESENSPSVIHMIERCGSVSYMRRIVSSGVVTVLPPPRVRTVIPLTTSEMIDLSLVIGSSSLAPYAAVMIACSPRLRTDPDTTICFARSSRESRVLLPLEISVTAIERELSMTQRVVSDPEFRLRKNPNIIQMSPATIRENRISCLR